MILLNTTLIYLKKRKGKKVDTINNVTLLNIKNVLLREDKCNKNEKYNDDDINLDCVFLSKIYHNLWLDDVWVRIKD